MPDKDGIKRMSLVQVRLARDSLQTPWGFRLQGGKDLNQALTVQRVFANTPSERELQRGDIIVAINGRDTTNLTHKSAQDAISAGGGQIEFLVQRPLGPINIKPLSPVKDTRAPAFPQTPTRAPQINIPIHKLSGPQSPTRIIPISPQKPSPPKPTGRPVVHLSQRQNQGYDQVDMASSGFKPKKVTLNKFGGGGFDFGSSYGAAASRGTPQSPQRAPQSQGYRPVAVPEPAPTSPPISRGTIEYQTQFSAPQKLIATQQSQGGSDSAVVHLQYNSPIGLYSRDNIRDTYVGQTKGRALSPSQPQQQKPVPPGERDWNSSYLAQMVQSNDRRGQPQQQQQSQHGYHQGPQSPPQQQDYKFDANVGMSDF